MIFGINLIKKVNDLYNEYFKVLKTLKDRKASCAPR